MTANLCHLVVRVTGHWEEITFAPICAYDAQEEADLHISRAKEELENLYREFREFDEEYEYQEEWRDRLKRAALYSRSDLLGRWSADYYVPGFDPWNVRFQVWPFPVRRDVPESKP